MQCDPRYCTYGNAKKEKQVTREDAVTRLKSVGVRDITGILDACETLGLIKFDEPKKEYNAAAAIINGLLIKMYNAYGSIAACAAGPEIIAELAKARYIIVKDNPNGNYCNSFGCGMVGYKVTVTMFQENSDTPIKITGRLNKIERG